MTGAPPLRFTPVAARYSGRPDTRLMQEASAPFGAALIERVLRNDYAVKAADSFDEVPALATDP